MSRDYDHWLSEHYDYAGDGCSVCWSNEHPDATEAELDRAHDDMGLCGFHEHEAYTDYMADRADRMYDEMRDRQLLGE